MKEKIKSISAIWKSERKTTIEESSKYIVNFLLLLQNHNYDLFTNWYEKDNNIKEALNHKVELEQGYFERALNKKWNKDFEDIGLRVSYWTGNIDEGKSAEISFNVGAYGNKPFNKNSCVLTLPTINEFYSREQNTDLLIKLVVDYWKPDKLLINGEVIFQN